MLPSLPVRPRSRWQKALPIRIFLPQKNLQAFSTVLIFLYIGEIWLNGLRRKPFIAIQRRVALEGPAPCLPVPQFKADIFCYPQENFS